LGSSQTYCDLSTYNSTSEIQFDLSCAFGELWSVETFGQLSTFEQVAEDCSKVTQGKLKASEAKWNFYPPECNYDESSKTLKGVVDKIFTDPNNKCQGNKSCKLSIKYTDLPPSKCNLAQATAANWQYLMVA